MWANSYQIDEIIAFFQFLHKIAVFLDGAFVVATLEPVVLNDRPDLGLKLPSDIRPSWCYLWTASDNTNNIWNVMPFWLVRAWYEAWLLPAHMPSSRQFSQTWAPWHGLGMVCQCKWGISKWQWWWWVFPGSNHHSPWPSGIPGSHKSSGHLLSGCGFVIGWMCVFLTNSSSQGSGHVILTVR